MRIESLAIDPRNPEMVYAGTNGRGFAFLSPEAKRMVVSNEGLMSSIVLGLAPDPHHAQTIYAGTGGSGVFKSVDGGKRWAAAQRGIATVMEADRIRGAGWQLT